MLTPRFELSQTDTEVLITVHAPYTNIKDCEVYVEGTDFRFFSTPYYLRLQLPGPIIENDDSDGIYDSDKGDFYLRFAKINKGEHFENLDLITNLLAPPKKKKNFNNIEIIENPAAESDDTNGDAEDWFIDQKPHLNLDNNLLTAQKYGFGNKLSNALAAFEDAWLKEIIDLSSPDTTPMEERHILREMDEKKHFNEEYYMADLMKREDIDANIMTFSPVSHSWSESDIILSDEEKNILKELPNKDYLLDQNEIQSALLGIVDILFGSCYNERTTLGDNTVESGWTINKLSSTLSWFETFSDINQVVKACMRRSLCFPLIRNWEVSVKVFQDVKKAIELGRKNIIKRLCEIHTLFNNSFEPRYILNQLYIKDYLIWLQKVPASTIEELYLTIADITPLKKDVGFDLEILEQAALSVYEEYLVIENSVEGLEENMKDLALANGFKPPIENESRDTDSDSSSSTSDSSDSSSDSSSESLDSDDEPDLKQ